MKIETCLNAMLKSREEWVSIDLQARLGICPRDIYKDAKFFRQYHAFRDRIIRVDERNNMFIATLGATVQRQKERIAELEETIREMRGFL